MALKEFVLFRHAKKNFDGSDPELSIDGFQQARSLVEVVKRQELIKPQLLLCSPRKRARQTLAPLQEAFDIPLMIHPALDERLPEESRAHFKNRIYQFLIKELPQKNTSSVFLCTHFDWIEIFVEVVPLKEDLSSDILHLPPASYYHVALSQDPQTPWDLIKKGEISL